MILLLRVIDTYICHYVIKNNVMIESLFSTEVEEDFIRKIEGKKKKKKEPEVPKKIKLLLVGKTNNSIEFAEKIQKAIDFEKFIHIEDPDEAITEMLADRFEVVVIDNDAPKMDSIRFSRIIRINNPLARIITISEDTSTKLLMGLINLGSIDLFLPLPFDDFLAYSSVLEQHAKYEIGYLINEYIINPPKYSPAYYLRQDPTLLPNETKEVEIIGCMICYQSVTRFIEFYKDILVNDEFLLSGYISAITMLGGQLFQEGKNIEEINFGGISVFFHFEGEIQYSFFVQNLTVTNYEETELMISELIKDITFISGKIITGFDQIEQQEDDKIKTVIRNKLKSPILSEHKDDNPGVLAYGDELLIVSIIINSFNDEFKNYTAESEEDVMITLFENNIDILLISPISGKTPRNINFAAKIKEKLPRTQIVGTSTHFKSNELIELIKSNSVDFVISNMQTVDECRILLREASKRSQKMKTSQISHKNRFKHNFLFTYDQTSVAKSLLKESMKDYTRINSPELHVLIITRDDLPFYSKFWQFKNALVQIDELMFSGFISSLSMFSREMFTSTEPYASITFGDGSLLILNYFDISFAFFVVNIDSANYLYVKKHIDSTVLMLFNLITNTKSDQLDTWDQNLPQKIEQLGNELFLKFSSINLT